MNSNLNTVIAGGGHAGAEAAFAASRLGVSVTLVSMGESSIARMSCNPAIGGLGKGHLVQEIDALGGLMGIATDNSGIQFGCCSFQSLSSLYNLCRKSHTNKCLPCA